MNQLTLDGLLEAERTVLPSSRCVDKSKSRFMKFIGFFVRLFNKDFMTRYTTTIGTTSYFPPAKLNNTEAALEIEAHEFVHKWDYSQNKIKFVLGYLFSRKYRRDAEIRGYVMSLYWLWLRACIVANPTDYVPFFTGPDYLYMERDGNWVKDELARQQRMFIENEEDFLNQPGATPYRVVKEFVRSGQR